MEFSEYLQWDRVAPFFSPCTLYTVINNSAAVVQFCAVLTTGEFTTRQKQANFEKIVISRPVYGFVTYLMEYAFTFTFASREFPPISACCIVRDSINRPGDLDCWPFDH